MTFETTMKPRDACPASLVADSIFWQIWRFMRGHLLYTWKEHGYCETLSCHFMHTNVKQSTIEPKDAYVLVICTDENTYFPDVLETRFKKFFSAAS